MVGDGAPTSTWPEYLKVEGSVLKKMTIHTNYALTVIWAFSKVVKSFTPISSRIFFKCNDCKHITDLLVDWNKVADRLSLQKQCNCGQELIVTEVVPKTVVFPSLAQIKVTGKFEVFHLKYDEEGVWITKFNDKDVIFKTDGSGYWEMSRGEYDEKKPQVVVQLNESDDELNDGEMNQVVEEVLPNVAQLRLEMHNLKPIQWFDYEENKVVWRLTYSKSGFSVPHLPHL
ncbi:hypothetical protein L2E82_49436 [Cichorium intybus]|uniref:Uncharacterized protein n=1 Tax=Cichorium intybus TaxID=13427 RepID=A0ACB8Z179_CICIN|nr:hypothetical protein L2E82_49436 [Cichorium intybus]